MGQCEEVEGQGRMIEHVIAFAIPTVNFYANHIYNHILCILLVV